MSRHPHTHTFSTIASSFSIICAGPANLAMWRSRSHQRKWKAWTRGDSKRCTSKRCFFYFCAVCLMLCRTHSAESSPLVFVHLVLLLLPNPTDLATCCHTHTHSQTHTHRQQRCVPAPSAKTSATWWQPKLHSRSARHSRKQGAMGRSRRQGRTSSSECAFEERVGVWLVVRSLGLCRHWLCVLCLVCSL